MQRRALVILSVMVAGAVALRLTWPEVFDPHAGIAWLKTMSLGQQIAVFVLAYTVLTTLAVPAVAFHVAAGIAFGVERGIPIALLGGNLASNLHFGIGRALGAERLQRWLQARGVLGYLDRHSIVSMMLMRALPLPFVGVNVGCGAAGIKWHHFAIGSGLGLVAATTVQTLFAAELYQGVDGANVKALAIAGGAALGLVALAALGSWLRNRSRPAA
ncbi:MAG: VTT domain-containing protein [Archangiaceae bacterium]|nr:VTT domain-containing protein [Archangiaceae bacterium]